ncbi:MAG: RecX family transcriptional regulator, partial [Krumholzibacteria bacterium]|nr:RecX family transcriptional regulator [Candidatus Krumholzibacteria bacterium]
MNDSSPHPGNREQPAASRLLLAVRRDADAVVLVLDGGEDLELAPEAVPAGLEPGLVLQGETLAELRRAAERKRAARRIFAVLDRRLVPVVRLRRRLAEDGCDPAAVDEVLALMAARGLYSDRTYADAWCRQCLGGKAVGRQYLEARLREKGVPPVVAREAAADALDPATEAALAARAAVARWRKVRGA